MTKSYGVGIIGAGWVAGEYVKAFRDHPLTQIVGMYNKTPEKATNLMKTHGVDGKEFKSVDALLDDKRIDIVVHCAHADTRAEYISRAAVERTARRYRETGQHLPRRHRPDRRGGQENRRQIHRELRAPLESPVQDHPRHAG